uniref:Uncharacterized protein n=1 Tax=Guillardia theta TaxID=55529 RepID=A0A7S4H8K0_GUITH|mmetsp:Transcript_10264/g.34221  ORF Transcript_10264/g.34221 Transcript_10264/m.34221 type:complete len:116 (+) Transcript_10264:328-675(+)
MGSEGNGEQLHEGRRQDFPSSSSSSHAHPVHHSIAQPSDHRMDQMTNRSSDMSQEWRRRKENVKRREKSPAVAGRKGSPYRSPQTRGESPKSRGSSHSWSRDRPGWDSSVDSNAR